MGELESRDARIAELESGRAPAATTESTPASTPEPGPQPRPGTDREA